VATPKTPTRTHIEGLSLLSPPKPTPSKLHCFLLHAEQNLGVPNAITYETSLHAKGHGPDILHLVPDNTLDDLGVRPGDVIRLKIGCVSWWNGPDAKWKCHDDNTIEATTKIALAAEMLTRPLDKRVWYECNYSDGGAKTFWGPPVIAGKTSKSDRESTFFCDTLGMMLPIPVGYTIVEEEDDDPFGMPYPE
jgi:hypothetical protein